MSEIWWKYWDEVADYQKKQQEKQQTENEKAAKEAQNQWDKALKDGLDSIETEYKLSDIPEDDELKAEEEYLKKRRKYLEEHCDKSSDTWNDYWTDLLESEKKLKDKILKSDKAKAKEDAEEWSKAFEELSETQKKAYDELTKQKEKAFDDLSGIDLTSTVTGADGKEKTILTDLDAATKKLTEYQNSLARLKKTGISDDLLNEILSMDYDSGARQSMINTLLGLSEEKRKLYYDDYEKYNTKAKEVAQNQVQDAVDELNKETETAVDNAFSSVTNSAYIAGADTAKSFLKGISENMSSLLTAMSGTTDLDTIRALLNIDSMSFAGSAKGPDNSSGASFDNTPIIINLNDKKYIETICTCFYWYLFSQFTNTLFSIKKSFGKHKCFITFLLSDFFRKLKLIYRSYFCSDCCKFLASNEHKSCKLWKIIREKFLLHNKFVHLLVSSF